ncbi:MAG: tetratricopeptide repeat protein [Acidobacteria bacterium]|nr:tetratricopeptide repeat protein [Acidobacteriota bacterium]
MNILGIIAFAAFAQSTPQSGYVAPTTCAACHRSIWETYKQTGMGRSFYRATAANAPEIRNQTYHHEASQSYFTTLERGGKFYQRRHQLDAEGREINVFEKQIDYIMGSGNHARTYLHKTPRGTLIELPLGWFAEKGGVWAMNPGYDRVDHDGFRRKVAYECMFCHNGYPKIPAGHEKAFAEPVYLDPLPEGIDCQRCHGPGRKHVQVAGTAGATKEAIRGAIVNPSRLSRERREEICIQCHLETTSFPLPNSLPRYEKGPFDFQPGEPLSASWLFFDHAAAAGRGDKFEIVNAVYRIRKSKCFVESNGALECASCHNPHDVPRGEKATAHYDASCRKCHAARFDRTIASGKHTRESGCADCHMPKRRTEDVVHSLATDHLIQRRKPDANLLAERPERHEIGDKAYRGEVVLYYPDRVSAGADIDLYLAVAQVVDKSNLTGGIPQLTTALQKRPAARAEFHLSLAEAWSNTGRWDKALPSYREAQRRDPKAAFLLGKLGTALRHTGNLGEAASTLQRAVTLAPTDPLAWHELGLNLQAQKKSEDAIKALKKSILLDPDLPEPHSNLALMLLDAGQPALAEASLREAIRIQPDYADAHDNLASLLAGTGDLAQARMHYEAALRVRPNDARTRYNYAMVLGRAQQFEDAQRQLELSLTADGNLLDARLLLGDLLIAKQQPREALSHYREAVRIEPGSARAHLGLGAALAMTGDRAAAIPHLQKAAASTDASARQNATDLLRQLGVVR